MTGRGILGILAAGIVLNSCGLESVSVLSAPDVDYLNQTLVTNSSLSFAHDSSRYSGQDFLGYIVYYKIYAKSTSDDFARLLADRNLLSSSPTVDRLVTLGYQSFTVSNSKAGTSEGIENLLVQPPGATNKVTLDFTDFRSDSTETSPPVIKFDDALADKPYLYRTMALVNGAYQKFNALRTTVPGTRQVDMASTTTDSELSAREYELNVFIAAYGVDSLLTEVKSSPVAWGVIRTIKELL